jgi:hypothetical protein
MAKNKKTSSIQARSMRTQQIIMAVIGVIVILSMIISIVSRY